MAKRKNSRQLNVRISEEEAEALRLACEETGQDQSDIVRACIKAFVQRVSEDGEVTRPFAIVSKRFVERKKNIADGGPPVGGVPAERSLSTVSTVRSRYPEAKEALGGVDETLPIAADDGGPSRKSYGRSAKR